MKTCLIFFLPFTLCAFSCNAQLGDLQGKWTHAYEEDAAGLQLYVKGEERTFSPARFRQVFVFQNDKVCMYTSLAANDAHEMRTGTYKLKEDILVIQDLKGNKLYQFRISKATEDKVMLEKL